MGVGSLLLPWSFGGLTQVSGYTLSHLPSPPTLCTYSPQSIVPRGFAQGAPAVTGKCLSLWLLTTRLFITAVQTLEGKRENLWSEVVEYDNHPGRQSGEILRPSLWLSEDGDNRSQRTGIPQESSLRTAMPEASQRKSLYPRKKFHNWTACQSTLQDRLAPRQRWTSDVRDTPWPGILRYAVRLPSALAWTVCR